MKFFVKERKMGFIEWLHTVKQGPQQTVQDFALELRELIEQTEPQMSQKIRIEIFVAGLPARIQQEVLMTDVQYLPEAVAIAEKAEQVWKSVNSMKRRGGVRLNALMDDKLEGKKQPESDMKGLVEK